MEQAEHKKVTAGQILMLQGGVLIFSLSSVMMKLSSNYPVLSRGFILCYGAGLMLLGVYAILWQQFLKRIPLGTAYANRAMSMLWSMVFGTLFLSETIKWTMVLGVLVIAAGILVMVSEDVD